MLKTSANRLNKIATHLQLLCKDPERFGRNLLQYTNPAEFEARLVDILAQPPLHVRVIPSSATALNVLQPRLDPQSMTGGPNTIVLLAALVAETGVPVRIVTSKEGHRPDPIWFARHVSELLGREPPPQLQVCSGIDSGKPMEVGYNDLWLATHWTTAQAVRAVLPQMRRGWFFYLVQDFEPGFYAWSSNYALAIETYGMPHRSIINERFLADYLRQQGPGLYRNPAFLDRECIVFEPAVDRRVFYPPQSTVPGSRQLLFYARPSNFRNLFGLALKALRMAIAEGLFKEDWEFISIGTRGSLPELSLGNGCVLRPARWQSYTDYAEQLRSADVLLCPMLSPHTSYPVLEMAASGGTVVTTSYETKTAERLRELSPDIIGVPATSEGLVGGLREAVTRSGSALASFREDRLGLEGQWEEVLRPVTAWIAKLLATDQEA